MTPLLSVGAALLRLAPPETAHRLTVKALAVGAMRGVTQADPALAVTLPRSRLALPNPIGLAAGFDKNAEAFGAMLALGFGFVEAGTVTPRPQPGNPRPRLFRLKEDRAAINRMGFNNDGLEAFASRLARRTKSGVVGANVGANKESADRVGDYVQGLTRLWPWADYLTLNVSSPNTPGLRGLQDRGALEELLGRCGEAASQLATSHGGRAIFLKVAPDLDDRAIADIAEIVLAAEPIVGLIVSNTTVARPVTLRSRHREESGGLSGAPLFAPSTEVLRRFAIIFNGAKDLIGAGGVASGADALSKLKAGAHAVQLYTAMVYEGPQIALRIARDLKARVAAEGFSGVAAAVGADLP